MSDLSNCFTRSDLVWLELPHKWFPQQFGESSKFFDTILRRAQCPVVFVLHKPLSSPLLRIKWFKEFLDSLNLSRCCTCCFGANTHCLVYVFSRGLIFQDRTCAQRVPASIVTGEQETTVWKMFVENWLRSFFPITFPSPNEREPFEFGPPGKMIRETADSSNGFDPQPVSVDFARINVSFLALSSFLSSSFSMWSHA